MSGLLAWPLATIGILFGGFPRLRRLVTEYAAEQGSLVDILMDELRSFTGSEWEQEDDITLVTLQRS